MIQMPIPKTINCTDAAATPNEAIHELLWKSDSSEQELLVVVVVVVPVYIPPFLQCLGVRPRKWQKLELKGASLT